MRGAEISLATIRNTVGGMRSCPVALCGLRCCRAVRTSLCDTFLKLNSVFGPSPTLYLCNARMDTGGLGLDTSSHCGEVVGKQL